MQFSDKFNNALITSPLALKGRIFISTAPSAENNCKTLNVFGSVIGGYSDKASSVT